MFDTLFRLWHTLPSLLTGVPIESIRLRFAFLQSLNNTLETFFLPLIDLRPWLTYSRSTAALLSRVRGLIFYDTKCTLMNRILNATAKRKPDQAAPEITLDPLEDIGGGSSRANIYAFLNTYITDCLLFYKLNIASIFQCSVALLSFLSYQISERKYSETISVLIHVQE